MQFFILMSKVNLGTLPSTQNTFSVLLDSVCAVTALITNCDKSQIATAGIPELSQFVTVAICECSKHNFSDRFHSNRGYTPKCRKHVHIKIGPFQEGFLGTSIMGFITVIHTHKHIYQSNNTKMSKKCNFSYWCQKWTWVLSQVPRTRFQCYLTQFVPSRPWSQIATNHKLRRQGFLNCRNLWLSQFVSVQNTTSQIDFIVTEGILLSAENMFTSTSDPFNKVSWVHRFWAL